MSRSARPVANANTVEVESDSHHPPGYRRRRARLGPVLGAEMLGATVYELDAGESVCPYHYEYGNEEWLLVLAGHPTLRTPDGEEQLRPGDAVCFREGPEGAHKITNRGDGPTRILMLSTMVEPAVALYPDSGKIGAWPPGQLFRQADAVDYFDGETVGEG